LTTKQNKHSCSFDLAFFTTVFPVVEKLCAVFKVILAEKKLLNPTQVAETKLLGNEARIYQEADFLHSTEGIY